MWPIQLVELSAVTTGDVAGNRYIVPASRTATAYSIFSNRDLLAPGPASDDPEPSSHPVSDKRKAFTRIAYGKVVHPTAKAPFALSRAATKTYAAR